MEYNSENGEIKINREMNNLDRFVYDFISLLEDNYVIVSGYVSIITGRSRSTEDVDLLVPIMDYTKFFILFKTLLGKGYECANTSNPKEAFEMLGTHAIRFYVKGKPIPNIEFKIIKNDLDKYSFENKIRVIVGGGTFFISPLEMQIAYKLHLNSEKGDKDMEDARHLYKLFKDKINKEKLSILTKKLGVESKMEELE